jgi:hypothetical protein
MSTVPSDRPASISMRKRYAQFFKLLLQQKGGQFNKTNAYVRIRLGLSRDKMNEYFDAAVELGIIEFNTGYWHLKPNADEVIQQYFSDANLEPLTEKEKEQSKHNIPDLPPPEKTKPLEDKKVGQSKI